MLYQRLNLPSEVGGDITSEVGYFECAVGVLVPWLAAGLGGASSRPARWTNLHDATTALSSRSPDVLRAVVPIAGWSLLLTSGPHGTDVGVIPSLAARELGIRSIRAVVADAAPQPARILDVYGPDGTGPLSHVRYVAAAKDGERWVFEASGPQLPFERSSEYERRRKSDRLTSTYLYELLRGLGVPLGKPPAWKEAVLLRG